MSHTSYEAGQGLFQEIADALPQAGRHMPSWANLHIAPPRNALLVTELNPGEHIEMYDHRLLERSSSEGGIENTAALYNDVSSPS